MSAANKANCSYPGWIYSLEWIYSYSIQCSRLIHRLSQNHSCFWSGIQWVPIYSVGISRFIHRGVFDSITFSGVYLMEASYSFPVLSSGCPQRNYLVKCFSIDSNDATLRSWISWLYSSKDEQSTCTFDGYSEELNLFTLEVLFICTEVNYSFMVDFSSTRESLCYPRTRSVRHWNSFTTPGNNEGCGERYASDVRPVRWKKLIVQCTVWYMVCIRPRIYV